MYTTSLFYKIKKPGDEHNRIFEIFFKAWVDDNCDNQVEYKDLKNKLIQVDCNEEDAIALKLKGIPFEFKGYLEILN